MGKGLLFIAVILTGMGLLMQFGNVFHIYNDIDTNLITPLTNVTTSYTASDNSSVPNFNGFDHIIMHNLFYILYIGAAICVVIGLGQMRSGGE